MLSSPHRPPFPRQLPLAIIVGGLVALGLFLAGCTEDLLDEPFDTATDADPAEAPDDTADDAIADDGAADDGAGDLPSDVAGYDPTLERDDDLCLPDDTEGTDYLVAHQVVDGVLGATCHGQEDPALIEAWQVLAELTPAGQLRDLAVFGGFQAGEDGDAGVTLAFVAPTADDAVFEMSVNLSTWGNDPVEDAFSMAHEFSHVFTAVPVELDPYADPADCPNYDGGGVGCYAPDSIMAQWYDRFWADTGYSPTADDANDPDIGEQRCRETPGFFGDYAASNPEEDFAESFAAYVMAWDAATPEQQDRLDWIDQFTGLQEFRERAAQFGYSPQENTLAVCGV